MSLAAAASERKYDENDLDAFVDSAAGDLIDRSVDERGESWAKVFHQALSDYLRAQHHDPEDVIQRRLTEALLATIPRDGDDVDWLDCSTYVRDHFASHAAAAGALDNFIAAPGFLIAADPLGLLTALRASHAAETDALTVARTV